MKTIVAVAFQNKKTVFEHAGKCRNYLIYTINEAEIESKKLLELTKEETLHSFFHGENNLKRNNLLEVDILLTKGIGTVAFDKLTRYGVTCYKIEENDPDEAINKLINGTLEAVSPVSYNKSGCNCNCRDKNNSYHHQQQL